ncbi:MAG: MobF family relaxase [Nitrospirota bacterium]
MVTIGKIYEKLKEYEKDNYYLSDEQGNTLAPEKIGEGWEKLGFKGEINETVYKALKEGKDPSTGEQLVQSGVNGDRRSGYNFTLSPDKSWTVYAHSSPSAAKIVLDIHSKSVADAMRYLESDLAQVRQGAGVQGKSEPVKTGNILAMRVDHQVNREGDIQLHSHIVAFNQTYNPETGKWQALHSDAFHSDVLTKLYENQLAYYAQEAGLAVEWKLSDSGRTQYAALAGVPDKAVEVTSERARQVDEYVKEHYAELKAKYPHASDGELKQIAALETRKDKVSMTPEQIDKQFTDKLGSVGLTREDIVSGVEAKAKEYQEQRLDTIRMNEYEVLQQAAKSLTDYSSTFSKQELLKAATDISKGDVSITQLQDSIKDLDKEIVKLSSSHTISDRGRAYNDAVYTSPEVLQAEKQAFRMVEQGKGQIQAIMSQEEAQKAIAAWEQKNSFNMTESQRNAVQFFLTSTDRYTAVQGYAGTGKTTVMKSISELAKEKGYRIVGISETNVAVQEMKAAGMEAMTATKFLHDHKLHQSMDDKTIVISDESSFMGAKNFKAVQSVIEKSGARTSFWGDKEQLPPISAGYPFKELIDRGVINHVEVKDIIRQKDEAYLQAVKDVVSKKIDSAFSKLHVVEDKYGDLHQRAAEIYKERGGYKDYIISTYTNSDKDRLNTMIRADLQTESKVSKEGQTLQVWENKNLSGTDRFNTHNYQSGDKLVVMQAGSGAGKVGAELTVKSIDPLTHTVIAEGVDRKGQAFTREIDIRRHGDKFNTYSPVEREFAKGDKIIFSKTDKETGIANSEVAYIKSINQDGSITFDMGGKEVTTHSRYFEYGYASTTHKSQGKTSQGTIYFAPVQVRTGKDGNTLERGQADRFQDFYVGISRGRAAGIVITNEQGILKEQVSRLAEKDSTFNYSGSLKREIAKAEKEIAGDHNPDSRKLEKLNALRDDFNRLKAAERERQPVENRGSQTGNQFIRHYEGGRNGSGKGPTWELAKIGRAKLTYSADHGLEFSTVKRGIWTHQKKGKVLAGADKGERSFSSTKKKMSLHGGRYSGVTVRSKNGVVSITKWEGRQTIGLFKPGLKIDNSHTTQIDVKGMVKHLNTQKEALSKGSKAVKHIDNAIKHLEKLERTCKPERYEKGMQEISRFERELSTMRMQERQAAKNEKMMRSERGGKREQGKASTFGFDKTRQPETYKSQGGGQNKTHDSGAGVSHKTGNRDNGKSKADNSKSKDSGKSKSDNSRSMEKSR